MSTFIDILKEAFAKFGSMGIGSSRTNKIAVIQTLLKIRSQCYLNFDTPEELVKIYPPAVGRLFEGSESPFFGIRQEEREQEFGEVLNRTSVAVEFPIREEDSAATSAATPAATLVDISHESSAKPTKKKQGEEKEDLNAEAFRVLAPASQSQRWSWV